MPVKRIYRTALSATAFVIVVSALAIVLVTALYPRAVHTTTEPIATKAQTKRVPVDIPFWVTKPCAQEDSVNCRWIATGPYAEGNGKGHTFVVRKLAHQTCWFYAQRRYAAKHDHCESNA